jgi:hypothetical protein
LDGRKNGRTDRGKTVLVICSWSYYTTILIQDFCRSYGTLMFSCNFNIHVPVYKN